MTELPRGTVTMLFTDVEGSTRLLQELGTERYVRALEDHRRLLRETFAEHSGVEVEMQGDSFHFGFASARDALLAAVDAQRALADHAWPTEPIRVRIGMHTGEPLVSGRLYAGLDVHRAARVMSAGHGGQILLSDATRADLTELPHGIHLRDLGEHRLKDLSTPQRLFQVGDEAFPPLKALYRTNLPVPVTPFVGRERELQEVTALLATDDVRLLTLTGAGGTGKTRLAAQTAADVSDLYPDGVFWVPLASLRDPSLVSADIAQALETKEELVAHVGSKRLLLLLDNFEHVLPAAREIGDLLAACPHVTVLVTSRERLNLTGEREYVVLPLRESDAVSLFLERVRAVGVATPTGDEVAAICRLLDHLPLAIELAAARAKVLEPAALLERLEQRLPLLTGGARDLPERQRTLRATIEWSHDLLTPAEQQLFARLAVFAGGCTLEAAEDVCDADLDLLQSLVDKSLLRHSDGRFRMLATIREYASERLDGSTEAGDVRRRHAEFFIRLAERGYADLRGPDAAVWMHRLDDEHDNLRSVLAFFAAEGDWDGALLLAGMLSRYWFTRGLMGEGRRWLETTLRETAASSRGRSRVLVALNLIALEQGDLDAASAASQEALALDRKTGDDASLVSSMLAVADVTASKGDLDRAAALWDEAAELARRRGMHVELGIALYNLAHVARHQEQHELAEARFEEALGAFREVDDLRGQAGALFGLVQMAGERGAVARGLSLLQDATELMTSSGYVAGVLDAVELYAGLFEKSGEPEAAARLSGARHALNEELGRQHAHPLDLAAHDEVLGRIRAALGDEAFQRVWSEGASMTLDEAVAFALERSSAVAERV